MTASSPLIEALFSIAGGVPPHQHETSVRLNGECHAVVYEHTHGRRAQISTNPDSPAFSDPGDGGEIHVLEVYGDGDDEHRFNLAKWFEVNYPGLVERELWEALR